MMTWKMPYSNGMQDERKKSSCIMQKAKILGKDCFKGQYRMASTVYEAQKPVTQEEDNS